MDQAENSLTILYARSFKERVFCDWQRRRTLSIGGLRSDSFEMFRGDPLWVKQHFSHVALANIFVMKPLAEISECQNRNHHARRSRHVAKIRHQALDRTTSGSGLPDTGNGSEPNRLGFGRRVTGVDERSGNLNPPQSDPLPVGRGAQSVVNIPTSVTQRSGSNRYSKGRRE